MGKKKIVIKTPKITKNLETVKKVDTVLRLLNDLWLNHHDVRHITFNIDCKDGIYRSLVGNKIPEQRHKFLHTTNI